MQENKREERNSDKIILDLCGGTGSWSRPYKEAGYDVRLVTLPEHDIRDFYVAVGYIFFKEKDDELQIPLKKIYGVLAAPPCTMFSLARTKAKKSRDLTEGMEIVRYCLDIIWSIREKQKLAFWALENPMGLLRQFLGIPLYTFDPSQFGGDYNKTTDLWGYFKMPIYTESFYRFSSTDKNTRKLPEIPVDYKIDKKMSRTAIKRSITPAGFARAFYEANR